jgi:hypothetical protein
MPREYEKLSATARAERSRATTRAATARELLYAGVLSRVWPAYLTAPVKPNDGYPWLLCVESPVGVIVWRLAIDEREFFEWVTEERPNAGERAHDRTAILMALSADGGASRA